MATQPAAAPGIAAPGPIGPRRQGGVPMAIKGAIVASAALIPLAFVCLHRLAMLNDYVPLMTHLRDHGPSFLPGSTDTVYTRESSSPDHPEYPKSGDPIVRVFTGNVKIDNLLRVLNVFFAPVFRDEELTALCISFTGLFGVAVALLFVEGERKWGGWKKIFAVPSAWGLMMQGGAFGFIMPIYSLLYLLATGAKPSTTYAIPHTSSARIRALPSSIGIGFIVPTLAMWILSRVGDSITQQYAVALWQIFPVYVAMSQFVLCRFLSAEASAKEAQKSVQANLETLYQFLIFFSRVFHLGTIAYCLTSYYRFSEDSKRMPINAERLLVPANPFNFEGAPVRPIASFADGTLQFLQYDYIFGTASFCLLVWATKEKVMEAVKARGRGIIRGEVAMDRVITAVLEGPGAVLAKMAWEREAGVWDLANAAGEKTV